MISVNTVYIANELNTQLLSPKGIIIWKFDYEVCVLKYSTRNINVIITPCAYIIRYPPPNICPV